MGERGVRGGRQGDRGVLYPSLRQHQLGLVLLGVQWLRLHGHRAARVAVEVTRIELAQGS